MNRRELGLGVISTLAAATILPSGVRATEQEDLVLQMQGWMQNNLAAISVEGEPGKGPRVLRPTDARVIEAAKYLTGLPRNKEPIELAKMMMSDPIYGGVWEWPNEDNMSPANPIIVAFFSSTNMKPEGDVTPWCAAGMGWWLRHCGYPSSGSAASASYRNFKRFPVSLGDDKHPVDANTAPEMQGDIIVLRDVDDDAHGHVTFFDGWVDQEKKVAWCVGGNQSNKINRAQYRLYSGPKRLVAIRRPVVA